MTVEQVSTAQTENTTVTDAPDSTAQEQYQAEEGIVENPWAEMSDEEFMQMDFSAVDDSFAEESVAEGTPNAEEEGEVAVEENAEEEAGEALGAENLDADPTEEEASESEESEESEETNYKDAYEKIFAPFKANGHEIKVDSPDDVIRLMQMGTNYHEKMKVLKPGLKTLKTLEKNGLNDDSKLALLIDASKGNPEAIKSLLRQHKIDPHDIDLEEQKDYKPELQRISDSEYELSEVMSELRQSPHYERTLKVVTSDWDTSSKQIVVNEPRLLQTINQHVEKGMYDIIAAEMVKQRALGKVDGMTDIQAYKVVGEDLDAKGAFDHLASNGGSTTSKQRQPIAKAPRKPKEASPQTTQRKKEAMPTRSSAKNKPEMTLESLVEMSDEEFMKQFNPNAL